MSPAAGPAIKKPGARARAGLLVFAALGCAAAAAAAQPDVLLITVDTLRPDALGWIAGDGRTPWIDALARAGFRCPSAVAPSPLTLPSHTSILTALLPRNHGVRDNGQVVPPAGAETLAERLRRSGWTTAAFVSGFPLAATFGLDRGFEHYDDRFTSGPGDRLERSAAETVAAALAWSTGRAQPWFLWIHLYDPHDPYAAAGVTPAPGGPRAAYDAEVAAVDRALARFDASQRPPGRERVTLFAADHGESLGEHGEATHGFFVYQSTLAVPMILAWPGRVAPAESRLPLRLIDLAPTLLDLLGLPAWHGRDGVSLGPLLAGEAFAPPPAFAESLRPWRSYGWSPLEAVIDGRWKLIAAPRPELYDLAADPGERRDLYATERGQARRLAELLRALPATAPAAATRADDQTLARLRALGYLGGGAEKSLDVPRAGLADPKDRLAVWNLLGAGESALESGAARAALGSFDQALALDPDNPFALARSAAALAALGDDARALPRLLRALERAPGQAEVRRDLAALLVRSGRAAEAEKHWLWLVREYPRDASYWLGLGAALGRSGEARRALEAIETAAGLEPDDAETRARVGFAAFGAGDLERAARELRHASELAGSGAFAHSGALGVVLDQLGRPSEARPWLERSRPTEAEHAEARFRLARLRLAAGELDAARAALREALAADPRLAERVRADPALAGLR